MEKQKAYKLVVDNLLLDEPYHYEAPIVYAKTAGEAKSKGISHFYYYQVENMYDYGRYKNRDIVFTDIKAKRVKRLDKTFYKDRWQTQEELEKLEWQDKRDEEAKQLWLNNPDGIAVVHAGCYNQWWGANRCGYSSDITYAGKYSTKEAYDIVRGSSYDRRETVILLDKDKYNAELKEKAEKLLNCML
jgi:hypothetical protein